MRFCDNYRYSGYLYSLAPKPTCPVEDFDNRDKTAGFGKIRIYKRNIFAYHIPAHFCGISRTLVKSFEEFFGGCNDNRPGVTTRAPGNLNRCIGSPGQLTYYSNFKRELPYPLGDLNQFTNDTNQFYILRTYSSTMSQLGQGV